MCNIKKSMKQREGNQCANKPIFPNTSNHRLTDKQNGENYECVKLTRRQCRYQKNKAKEKLKVDIMDRKSYFLKFCFHWEQSFFFYIFVFFVVLYFFYWYLPNYRCACTTECYTQTPKNTDLLGLYLFPCLLMFVFFCILFSVMSSYNSLSRRMFKCKFMF